MANNLVHIQILSKSEEYGERLAITDPEGTVTFNELRQLSYQLATLLKKQGLTAGGSVLVCLENDRWHPIIFLASALLGATTSGVSPLSTPEELRSYAAKCDADVILCTLASLDKVATYLSHLTVLCVGCGPADIRCLPRDLPTDIKEFTADISLDDVLCQPFSSGTGGPPKCVQLTHRNYNASTQAMKKAVFDRILSDSGHITISILPLFHASGFWALIFSLLEGVHVIMVSSCHPSIMLEVINKYNIKVVNLVPPIIAALCRYGGAAPSLEVVLSGASALAPNLINEMKMRFPNIKHIIQGYGMTEVVVLSHITPLDGVVPPGSCGKLLPGFESKLADEHGKIITQPNHRGELYLRSEAVMKGYKDGGEPLHDGWLRTGDIVYYDTHGFYFIVDRLKDLIKVNGLQVSPTEIEEVISAYKYVVECGVVGIPHPTKGQVPKAFVVLKENQRKTPEHICRKIIALVKDKLASHKHLSGGVEVRNELPRSSTGKVLRRLLK